MNGEPLQYSVKITNPHGFHLRPLTAFAELASKFQSTVTVVKDQEEPGKNGKSPFELLGLIAEQGSELTMRVSGPDQQAAFDALSALLTRVAAQTPETPEQ
jgi:phosphotransferase system HPr (HPr) family protein